MWNCRTVLAIALLLQAGNAKDCPYLSLPEGTNRTSDEVSVGTVSIYRCTKPSESFRGGTTTTLTARCLVTGVWNPMPHPCKKRRCDAQPVIDFATVTSISTLAGAEVIYRCFYGYGFADKSPTKTVTCDEDTLEWTPSPGDFLHNMTCDRAFCTDVPVNLTTGFYDGLQLYDNGNLTAASVITQYCNQGYTLAGKIQSTGKCTAAGKLDGKYGECTMQRCLSHPEPENTRTIFDNTEYQRRNRYQCITGRFPGGDTTHIMECDMNGQWKNEPALSGCQGGGCEPGWEFYNEYCYYISDGSSWGLRYYYAEESCVWKNAHLVTILDKAEGDFLYPLTYELYQRDFWIGFHYDAAVKDWVWFDGSNSTYKRWHRGYPELENSCGRFSIKTVWKDRDCDDLLPYICKKPALCSAPPVIANGGPDVLELPTSMDVGQSLNYVCDEGYSFISDGSTERTVTCLLGSYYSPIENCQATKCPPLNRHGYWVKNAVITGSQLNGYLKEVVWTCNPGYVFPDGVLSKTITCQANRTWSDIPPQCIEMHCPVPGILNAEPSYSSSLFGEVDIYKCRAGYVFDTGEEERRMLCQDDGTWYPGDSCWKKTCQPYVQLHGNITSGPFGVAKYWQMVEITCDEGYTFPDGEKVKTTRCGDNYNWAPYLDPCEPMTCPGGEAPDVANAIANSTLGTVGAVILYTCEDGYKFIDGDTERIAICDTKTREWINLPTECMSEIPSQISKSIGAGKTISTITAIVAILGIMIATIVVVCADCAEDRKVLGICQGDPDAEEEEDESDTEPVGEPIRLQMV